MPRLAPGFTWRTARLGDIVRIGSRNVNPNEHPELMWNYVGLENIEPGTGRLIDFEPTPGDKIGSTKASFRKGDVLYGKLRPYLRKAWEAEFDGCSSTDLIPLTPGPDVDATFLRWFLLSPFHTEYITPLMAGIRMPRLRSEDLQNMPVPVPPLHEQRRIVERIDAVRHRTGRVRQLLEGMKGDLRDFRNAIVSTAVSGSLTGVWRDGNPELSVARIGCVQEKGDGPGKLEKSGTGQVSNTSWPAIPDSWTWTSLGRLMEFVTSGSRGWAAHYAEEGALFLRVGNLDRHTIELDLNDVVHVNPPHGAEMARTQVKPGDLLISITADVGMVAVAPPGLQPSFVNQHVALCRPLPGVNSRMVAYTLIDPNGLQALVRQLQYGMTKASLSLEQVRNLPVPLPPDAEQDELVRRLDESFGFADRVEIQVEGLLREVDRLEQAAIAQAFTGMSG